MANTAFYIARRYLFSRKSTHAINIIAGISMLGVFIGSAALIIILSVFNGFERVILSLYNNFTPQLIIQPRQGKTFNPTAACFGQIKRLPQVFQYTEVLQEKALVRYGDRQVISTIKGVSDDFVKNPGLQGTIQMGSFSISLHGLPMAVIGMGVQSSLAVNIKDQFTALQIYAPRRDGGSSLNPMDEFEQRSIYPSGVYSIQQDFDAYVITPIAFARDLLKQPVNVSSIDINLKPGSNINALQQQITQLVGPAYTVKNRYEQNTLLYKILSSEKWAVFLILTFVLIIAIFNIVGALTMLVIDKRQDIAILTSLGAGRGLIQSIFFTEGMLISMLGCVAGMVVGWLFCFLQQQFGFIRMGATTSVVDAYPVDITLGSFVLVLLTVTVIATTASAISARLSVKGLEDVKQNL